MSMPNPDLENPIPTSLRSTVLCTGGRILHFFAPSSAQVAEFCIFLHFFCTVLCTGGRILHFLHFFLHPPLHRLQYFSSFQNFAFFSSQAWRVVGRPTGTFYGRCFILKTQIMTNILKSLELLKPRGTWPQTMPTRRTIFWGPCLALARFGCCRSTSICRSSRVSIKLLKKRIHHPIIAARALE